MTLYARCLSLAWEAAVKEYRNAPSGERLRALRRLRATTKAILMGGMG